jgi:small subunit ribosomal protein S4
LEYTQVTPLPAWVTLQKEAFKGTVVRVPTKEDIQPIANEQLVVELYSKA